MSVEEEIELRDLVAQTLESNGCLAKIRAQLRASIFLALAEDNLISQKQPLLNSKIQSQLSTSEGKTMFCIVREFFEFFDMYFTISVYEAETQLGNAYQFEGRQKLIEDLGLEYSEDTSLPILLQLIKLARSKTHDLEKASLNGSLSHSDKSVSEESKSTNSLKTEPSYNENIKDIDTHRDIILDATFDLSNPIVQCNGEKNETVFDNAQLLRTNKDNNLDSTYIKNGSQEANVSQENGSINEDIILASSIKVPEISSGPNDEHSKSSDKPKLSQKSDKLKSKLSLSSLSDLPPIQINKTRGTDILPSLYSKEFKDKSNLQELDKLFDMEVEYEEDFMCSGDELSLKSDYSKTDSIKLNLTDEASTEKSLSRKNLKQTKVKNQISDCNKPLVKNNASSQISNDNKRESSSCSSVSEMLEANSTE